MTVASFPPRVEALYARLYGPTTVAHLRAAAAEQDEQYRRGGGGVSHGWMAWQVATGLGLPATLATPVGDVLDAIQPALDLADNLADHELDRALGRDPDSRYPGVPHACLPSMPALMVGAGVAALYLTFADPAWSTADAVARLLDGFSPDLRGGVSIGSRYGASGTLGFVARPKLTPGVGPDFLLTSEHVLRYLDEAAGPDACVVQPGATSTSSAAATAGWVVANLAGFGNIQPQPFPNTMDAAVAAVIGGARPASWRQVHGVNLVGQRLLANLTIGMPVTKYGAASGTTSGTIVSLNGDAIWKYGRGRTARFAPMIVADLKACPGDSGAPVVFTDATGAYAVGIVSAAAVFGGNYRTFITPLDPITNTLGYVVA